MEVFGGVGATQPGAPVDQWSGTQFNQQWSVPGARKLLHAEASHRSHEEINTNVVEKAGTPAYLPN